MILAGITLNAVIGEDGIIFQAKDTKNMITNETEYDNQQLAALQNELKDNQLYTGIGIIPGTDTGGSSEGGESGSGGQGGGGDQGGSNTGGTNTNTGGSEGELVGEDAVAPTIRVIEGKEIAASFFRSDVTVQISTYDKTQKIKYILTTTVDEINNELYPSGLIKEIDIENGGTLTFTKDGEYTITAYSYDVRGNKSNSSVMWLKRETGTTPGNGVTVSIASGNMGQNDWYTSNITLRVLGTDTGSARVTYRVRGTAYSNGTIGNTEYQAGAVDTGEVDIANGTTFKIAIDGEFAIVAYTYDSGGMRLSTAATVNLKRDASRPIVTLYKGEQVIGEGFRISMAAEDYASDLATEGRYTYRHKLTSVLTYEDHPSQDTTYLYTGLEEDKTYDMYVIVKDEAGNMTASDVISRPAIWISNTPTVGDMVSEGKEGARKYCSTDVDVSLTGQDENNVDISRVTYQILGTTTGAGNMDGTYYDKGVALTEDELEMGNEKTIQIRADGNWTIKVHTYNKENVRVSTNTLEVTRDTVTPEPPVIEVVSGTMGEETYYRSDITVKLTSQDDTCYKKTTYVVTGTATGNGTIGGVSVTANQQVNITETEIANGGTFVIGADGRWTVKGNGTVAGQNVTTNQAVNIGETEIANNGTFTITADGKWTITAYSYDYSGRKSNNTLVLTRDTVGPTISSITKTGTGATTLSVSVSASDGTSGLASSGTYQYYLNNASKGTSASNTYTYTNVSGLGYSTFKVIVKDKAGNTSEKTLREAIATVKNFAYTGGQQSITLADGKYKLEVWGAQGGTGTGNYTAGKGAYAVSNYSFSANTSLKIIVGGKGKDFTNTAGSGGGGTFIATSSNTPIAVAGGGGGAYSNGYSGTYYHGQPTRLSVRYDSAYVNGITEGYGGSVGTSNNPSSAGAGGGFYGNGAYSTNGGGSGGYAFVNGGGVGYGYSGGVHGGFGGRRWNELCWWRWRWIYRWVCWNRA